MPSHRAQPAAEEPAEEQTASDANGGGVERREKMFKSHVYVKTLNGRSHTVVVDDAMFVAEFFQATYKKLGRSEGRLFYGGRNLADQARGKASEYLTAALPHIWAEATIHAI